VATWQLSCDFALFGWEQSLLTFEADQRRERRQRWGPCRLASELELGCRPEQPSSRQDALAIARPEDCKTARDPFQRPQSVSAGASNPRCSMLYRKTMALEGDHAMLLCSEPLARKAAERECHRHRHKHNGSGESERRASKTAEGHRNPAAGSIASIRGPGLAWAGGRACCFN
jgi:hypothetical protein